MPVNQLFVKSNMRGFYKNTTNRLGRVKRNHQTENAKKYFKFTKERVGSLYSSVVSFPHSKANIPLLKSPKAGLTQLFLQNIINNTRVSFTLCRFHDKANKKPKKLLLTSAVFIYLCRILGKDICNDFINCACVSDLP